MTKAEARAVAALCRDERQYFHALKRIAAYMQPEQLRKAAEPTYGLEYHEALEFAYENVIQEAVGVLRGKRPRKDILGSAQKPAASG